MKKYFEKIVSISKTLIRSMLVDKFSLFKVINYMCKKWLPFSLDLFSFAYLMIFKDCLLT